MEYINLDARGTIIKITKELADKSQVLKVWMNTQMKNKDEAYYINSDVKSVHNFIDCISGKNYREDNLIEDLKDQLIIDIKNEYPKYQFYAMISDTPDPLTSYNCVTYSKMSDSFISLENALKNIQIPELDYEIRRKYKSIYGIEVFCVPINSIIVNTKYLLSNYLYKYKVNFNKTTSKIQILKYDKDQLVKDDKEVNNLNLLFEDIYYENSEYKNLYKTFVKIAEFINRHYYEKYYDRITIL